MRNEHVLARFTPLDEHLVRPIYADYSFANIAPTVEALLTGERRGPLLPPDCFGGAYPTPRRVVLFFIDSFGWQFWQQAIARQPVCARIAEAAVMTPLSALFPSTTAASVSTLSLGVLPARHALYEWNVYIPAYGEVIQTLPFAPVGARGQDLCLARGHDPTLLLAERETVYQRLARHGVRSTQLVGRAYAASAYNRQVGAGARVVGYSTLAEALLLVRDALEAGADRELISFYWGAIDAIAHEYGPGSRFHEAEITSFWRTFEAVFAAPRRRADTLVLFFADHGQVHGDPEQTIYLNQQWPHLADLLQPAPAGGIIYPNGSPRDLFLHVRPGQQAAVIALLTEALAGQARVMSIDAALAEGLFGPPPHGEEFRRRLGDVLILPHAGRYVWWYERGKLANHFYGHHGGLTREEMITALVATDVL